MVAEATGEALVDTKIIPLNSENANQNISNISKVAGTLVGLTTGEVQTAADSAKTAVDNNLVPFVAAAILTEAYVMYLTMEAGSYEKAMEMLAKGEDPIGKGINQAIHLGWEGFKWVSPTGAALTKEQLLAVLAGAKRGLKAADDITGNTASDYWKNTDQSVKNQVVGITNAFMNITTVGGVGAVGVKVGMKGVTYSSKALASLGLPNGLELEALMSGAMSEAALAEAARNGGKGVMFVTETPRGNAAAQAYQAGTAGTFAVNGKNVVPALIYSADKGKRPFIKFDGWEKTAKGINLIDSKLNLPFWSKTGMESMGKTLDRIAEALKQNPGFNVVWEVPNQTVANKITEWLKDVGHTKTVTVRVRG